MINIATFCHIFSDSDENSYSFTFAGSTLELDVLKGTAPERKLYVYETTYNCTQFQ
jgi:hypothetical protein